MRIDILSVVPELLESPLNHSIIKRAKEKGIVEIHIHNIRDWSKDKHRKVDDYSFGGDAGLVMAVQPIFDCINELTSQRHYDEIIYTAPDAPVFNQKTANELSLKENIMILCGHYKGVDHRVREHLITREISVGDYVLPGAMGDETSALTDSFQDNLLAPPVYTRPAEFNGWRVPEVLLSGNHALIDEWQEQQALERTRALRPDLLDE